MKVTSLLATSLILSCAVGVWAGETIIPEELRNAMNHAYPGWQEVVTTKYMKEFLQEKDESVVCIHGDWDGDGARDYAVQFLNPQGTVRPQQVVAAIRRGRGFVLVPLDSFPPDSMYFLAKEKRGTEVVDLSADPEGGKTLVLRHDAIFIGYEEKGGGTCYWTGKGFRCISTSD